jgi:hypothetical protein
VVSTTGRIAGAGTEKVLDVAGNGIEAGGNVTSTIVGGTTGAAGDVVAASGNIVGKPIAYVGEKTGRTVGVPIGVLAAYNAWTSDPVLQRSGASLGEMVARHGSYQDSLNFVINQQETELRSALR